MSQFLLIFGAALFLLLSFFTFAKHRGFRLIRGALYLQHLQEIIDQDPGDESLRITQEQAQQAYQAARDDFDTMGNREGQDYCAAVTHGQLRAYDGSKKLLLTRAREHGFPE